MADEVILRKSSYAECLGEQVGEEKEEIFRNPHPNEVPKGLVFLGLVKGFPEKCNGRDVSNCEEKVNDAESCLKKRAKELGATHVFRLDYHLDKIEENNKWYGGSFNFVSGEAYGRREHR